MGNFVGLIILDGYGLSDKKFGNAVRLAKPKYINKYFKKYPYTTLEASGEYVGLPAGQIGNSEVGHLNIGAGKVVLQSLQKINKAIEDKSFFKNQKLIKAIKHAKENNSTLHLMGLSSTGGVHSQINHLYALIDMAIEHDVKKINIHFITDGRDTLRTSGVSEFEKLQQYISKYKNIKIVTVIGRMYSMDREKNFDRTQKAYEAMVNGVANVYTQDAVSTLNEFYDKQVFDEFIPPIVITKNNKPLGKIKSNDAIIFYNYRQDRARQITESLVEDNFKGFDRKKLKNVLMTTFTNYDEKFKNTHVAFDKEIIKHNLSSVVSKLGMRQFKITETTKYAHVTYFLNGGIEKPYKSEDRFLIETIKTERFDDFPKMRAEEITQKAIEEINSKKYNLMVLNYSNPDMLGHTGNLNATIEAIKFLNIKVKQLVDTILANGGAAIITADHGNAEEMIDKASGNILTDHTTNKVPFCIVSNNKKIKLQSGMLANIAPTILDLLGYNGGEIFESDSLILK